MSARNNNSEEVLDSRENPDALTNESGEGEAEEEESLVKCEFICGVAGSGKTTLIKNRIAEDPSYGLLCASTGIAGVNLGATTINAALRYFDTDSLRDSFIRGRLQRELAAIARTKKNIILDEVSMFSADQLDILYEAVREVNGRKTTKHQLGIILVGDFAQLAPVKTKWAFEAEHWSPFEENTTKLDKVWRQDNPRFLEAINLIRAGYGVNGALGLKECGIDFANANSLNFNGTTIVAKNDEVDRFNLIMMQKLLGSPFSVKSERWKHSSVNKEPGEWKLIPAKLDLKVGAYVMILSNARPTIKADGSPEFEYANGDSGWIVEDNSNDPFIPHVVIKLARNDKLVAVGRIRRNILTRYDPLQNEGAQTLLTYSKADYREGVSEPWGEPYYDELSDKFVAGSVRFFPLRVGYASTVHRSQGLTLDRVQIDCRNGFFGSPSMAYVSISRCRSPEGLRIVGTQELLARRVKVDPKVLRWI